MSTLNDINMDFLLSNLRSALDPSYYLRIEAVGNLVAYRTHLSDSMTWIHRALSLDSDDQELYFIIGTLYDWAPRRFD